MLNKEFLPYEEALALKELGFDEPCLALYVPLKNGAAELEIGESNPNKKKSKLVSAPLYQQAFRWFREKYGYYISVFRTHDGNWGTDLWLLGVHKPKATVFGETYEDAELECLNKLIEIVKNESK